MLAWLVFWIIVAIVVFAIAIFAIRNRGIHPGLILAALDTFGLVVASYLSVVELSGNVPVCGPVTGARRWRRASTPGSARSPSRCSASASRSSC